MRTGGFIPVSLFLAAGMPSAGPVSYYTQLRSLTYRKIPISRSCSPSLASPGIDPITGGSAPPCHPDIGAPSSHSSTGPDPRSTNGLTPGSGSTLPTTGFCARMDSPLPNLAFCRRFSANNPVFCTPVAPTFGLLRASVAWHRLQNYLRVRHLPRTVPYQVRITAPSCRTGGAETLKFAYD